MFCNRHAWQGLLLASIDIEEAVENGSVVDGCQMVLWMYEGFDQFALLLSPAFLGLHGIAEFGEVEMPDEFPSWFKELRPVCPTCVYDACPELDSPE